MASHEQKEEYASVLKDKPLSTYNSGDPLVAEPSGMSKKKKITIAVVILAAIAIILIILFVVLYFTCVIGDYCPPASPTTIAGSSAGTTAGTSPPVTAITTHPAQTTEDTTIFDPNPPYQYNVSLSDPTSYFFEYVANYYSTEALQALESQSSQNDFNVTSVEVESFAPSTSFTDTRSDAADSGLYVLMNIIIQALKGDNLPSSNQITQAITNTFKSQNKWDTVNITQETTTMAPSTKVPPPSTSTASTKVPPTTSKGTGPTTTGPTTASSKTTTTTKTGPTQTTQKTTTKGTTQKVTGTTTKYTGSTTKGTGTTTTAGPPTTRLPCNDEEFHCGDGTCILLSDKCSADGKKHCANGADQMFCTYAHTCRPDEYQCTDKNKTCIPKFQVCDGYKDCSDADDEAYCSDRCWNETSFLCDNGNCVDKMQVCDFNNDCSDNSDEVNCDYSLPTFTCDTGLRLPKTVQCNGVFDCKDKTDELFCACKGSNDLLCNNGYCLAYDQTHCNGVDDCGDGTDEPASCTCSITQFKCTSTNVCIPSYKICNNQDDCADQSDEFNCTCNKQNQFGCNSGRGPCIDNHQKCDGVVDCVNGADETNCPPCPTSQFECNGHICIPYSDYCDGVKQCQGGEDEPNECPLKPCPNNGFFCADGSNCISNDTVCDGFKDCSDGSDETNCPSCALHCDNNRCLQPREICDGIQQCNDGADEVCTCVQRLQHDHPEYINDGYPDCLDASDESKCPNAFQCPGSSSCLPSSQVCDGKIDCDNGEDEEHCVFLQEVDFTNKTIYEWQFDYKGLVNIQHPSGSYQQFEPEADILPLCVDGALNNNILKQLCKAGQAQPPIIAARYYRSDQVPKWFLTPNVFSVQNAKNLTSLSDLYAGLTETSGTCSAYYLGLVCTQQDCPTPKMPKSNVVGGQTADPYAWPYMVHILNEGKYLCGGILISEHHVLTAAHCVQGFVSHGLAVQGGFPHFSGLSPTSIMTTAHSVLIHPDYDPNTRDSDLALIHISEFFNSTHFVRPFCQLTGVPPIVVAPKCFALGWGEIYAGGPTSDALQVTELQTISQHSCSIIKAFNNPKNITITDNMICAGSKDGSSETCDGDDGGPLFCTYQNELYLAGITSWRLGCNMPNVPTVFAFVPNFLDWIDQNIQTPGNRVHEPTCDGQFQCADGQCLPSTKLCDGTADCLHGEDESMRMCTTTNPEVSCFFTHPSICGYTRDFSVSKSSQWMWVDLPTGMSSSVPHTINYPNYIMFTGDGENQPQKGRLNSVDLNPGGPNLCVFVDYKTFGAKAHFNVSLCDLDANSCSLFTNNVPIVGTWKRIRSDGLNAGTKYQVVIDALFDSGATFNDSVAINNVSVSLCMPPAKCDASKQFYCSNSDACIPSELYCDGRIDCPLGEDETDCGVTPCFSSSQYQSFYCPSGVNQKVYGGSKKGGPYCIDIAEVCDQEPDCMKSEDEANCTCSTNFLKCTNGRCMDHRYWCNGRNDCGDNSDEPPKCVCMDYLDASQICDGVQDCGDKSDESNCSKCTLKEYACYESGYNCIQNDQVCDGTIQCKMGEDERTCFKTSGFVPDTSSLFKADQENVVKQGEVQILYNDARYYAVCADSNRTVIDVGSESCSSMLFSTAEYSAHEPLVIPSKVFMYKNTSPFLKSFTLENWEECTTNQTVFVVCSNLECGVRQVPTSSSNIYGGTVAPLHAWPWASAIMTTPRFTPFPGVPFYHCGATLLNDQWALTSARCVSFLSTGPNGWSIFLRTGDTRLSANYEFQKPIVGALIQRNNTGTETSDPNNDIALLYLTSSFNLDYSIWPACLPQPGNTFPPVSANCFAVGYGTNDKSYASVLLSDDMLQKGATIYNCTGQANINNNYDPNRDVCVGGAGFCSGDIGSGLSCSQDNAWFASGVASRFATMGTTTCDADVRDLDTRASYYSDWVQNTLKCFPSLTLWPCNDGKGCIDWSSLCDGKQDCNDNSDETDCPSVGICEEGFRCKNKECARIKGWCDKAEDCGDFPDHSDELPGCKNTCPPDTQICDVKVDSRLCVPQSRICDGVYDCADKSDETACICHGDDEFKCKNGQCINKYLQCNGVEDCSDGSDETRDCSCVSNLPDSRKCDGIMDCPGDLDEANCECNLGEFTCNQMNGPFKCISVTKRCDGKPDCPAGEDEVNCFEYMEPSEFLGATVDGVQLQVCGDQWTIEAATRACNYQFYQKYYKSHVISSELTFRAYAYDPSKANMSYPYWFTVVNNCTSTIIIDSECGVPLCGVNTAFPDPFSPDGPQYTSVASQQAPFPSVGMVYYNNDFVCSGVLVDSTLFAVPASCMRNYVQSTVDLKPFTVRFGTSRVSAVAATQQFSVTSYNYDFTHKYSPKTYAYDYLLLSIRQSAPTNILSTWPACVAASVPSSGSAKCYAVGWVPSNDSDTYNVDQVSVEVAVFPNKFCHDADPSVLCVGHLNKDDSIGLMGNVANEKLPCFSQYGGVLMCREKNVWYFTGLFQANSTCDGEKTTAVSIAFFSTFTNNKIYNPACVQVPCRNGGTCVGDSGDYYCICEAGFSGENCERLSCDNSYTQPSGSFQTPAIFDKNNGTYSYYPNEADCKYNVTIDPIKSIKLSFGKFDLAPPDQYGNCSSDYIDVYQSWWHSNKDFIGRFCGNVRPLDITSVANNMWIQFHSTFNNQKHAGFAATYSSVTCGSHISGQSQGELVNPGYPYGYPKDASCTWHITVQPSQMTKFYINNITLYQGIPACTRAYVKIYNGTSEDAGDIFLVLCSPSANNRLFVLDNFQSTVVFHSQVSGTVGGVNISWYGDIDNCANSPCPAGSTCVDGVHTYTCTCPRGYVYNAPNCTKADPCNPNPCQNFAYCVPTGDSYKCLCQPDWTGSKCDVLQHMFVVNNTRGKIDTPNFGISNFPPSHYPNNYNGYWWIFAAEDEVVHLEFIIFDIEPDVRCSYDYVEIFEGVLASKIDGPLCNTIKPKPYYQSSTRAMTVTFTSDNTGTYHGFEADYQTIKLKTLAADTNLPSVCGGLITPVGIGGRLHSLFFPEPYPANLTCTWTITGGYSRLQLTFRSVHLAHSDTTCYDYVDVFDGMFAVPQKRIARVCDETFINQPLTTFSSSVTIVFQSSETNVAQNSGFYLDYIQSSALCANNPCLNGATCNDNLDFVVCTCAPGFTGPLCDSTTSCGGTFQDPQGKIVTGVVTSPNYPGDYNNVEDCLWTIVAPAGFLIYLRFDAFAIEPSNNLCLDFVKVYNDSSNINGSSYGSYCGFDSPGPFVSKANRLYIHLRTDETSTWPGFKATYDISPNYCKINNTCNDHQVCTNQQNGHSCQCLPGYTGSSCENVIDMCSSVPCVNNGTCTSSFNNFNCACMEGYGGMTCEIDLFCGAASNPCRHGATCEHGEHGPICHCTSDYAGKYCTISKCSQVYSQPSGLIQSPDYPYFYPGGIDCTYMFYAPAGQVAKFYFDDFDLMAPKDHICTDYLALYESVTTLDNTTIEGKWCGQMNPGFKLTTNSNFSTLVFNAAEHPQQNGGFSLRYFFDDDSCSSDSCTGSGQECVNNFDLGFRCACKMGYTGFPNCQEINLCNDQPCLNGATCSNMVNGFTCTCAKGFTGPVCEFAIDYCIPNPCQNHGFCQNETGGYFCNCREEYTGPNCETFVACTPEIVTEDAGYILSPGYPYDYPPNADCKWTLQTTAPKIFYMSLELVHIEGPFPACNYDSLTIYDGGNFSASPTYTICGIENPPKINTLQPSASSEVGLLFKSDDSVEASGFRLAYTVGYMGYCNGTINSDHGFMSSLGFTSRTPYPTDSSCIWTIIAPSNNRVYLTFDTIDLEPSCDDTYIDVYDYKYQVPWRLLDRICGNVTEKSFNRSFTNAMSFVFNSGPTNNNHLGFHANFLSKVYITCKTSTCQENAYCAIIPGGPRCFCYEGFINNGIVCTPTTCLQVTCPNGTQCVSSPEYGAYCADCLPGFNGRTCEYDEWCGITNPCNTKGGKCVHGTDGPICQCNSGYTGEHCENELPAYRCGGEYVTFPGLMDSPKIDLFYPPNADCNWILRSDDGKSVVSIYFDILYLQDSQDCSADNVKIFDSNGALLAKFCGHHDRDQNPLPVVTSSSNQMVVVFNTNDDGIQDFGFTARYFLSDQHCSATTCPVNSMCRNSVSGYTCTCLQGYTGSDCSTKIDYCQNVTCGNQGTCVSSSTGYQCMCPVGYTGQYCETFIDLCASGPCQNGGKCEAETLSYKCICTDGFYGPNCENAACDIYLNDTNGVITSPNYPNEYPNYLNCTWHIKASHRQLIDLRFIKLDVEGPSNDCIYDAIKVYEGPKSDNILLGSYCGHSDVVVGPIFSQDYEMTIEFTTDDTVSTSGFMAFWNFTSTSCYNYPCPAHASCITSPDLTPLCVCDYHYHGANCDRIDDCQFVTCGNGGTCVEDDEGSYQCVCKSGYTGPFCELVENQCLSFPCQHGGLCYIDENDSYLCECTINWGGRNCNETRNVYIKTDSHTGLITSPFFPNNYPANAHYLWIVNAYSPYVGVEVYFTSFMLEGYKNQDCLDYVVIYDGDLRNGTLSTRQLALLCGFDLPTQHYFSLQTAMSISFETDKSIQFQGFSLIYNLTCTPGYTGSNCTQVYSPTYDICEQRSIFMANGYLTAPADLSNAVKCPTTIDVMPYKHVPFKFLDFDIDDTNASCNTNFVAVYDGHFTTTLIGKYCNQKPPPIDGWMDTTDDALTVLLNFGDPTIGTSSGFNLTWSALLDVCVHANCGFGECIPEGEQNYTCKCDEGWTGDDCQMKVFMSYDICNYTGPQFIDNGFLVSPNYPANYLPNDDCTIQLHTRPGHVYSYGLNDFQLQMPSPDGLCFDSLSLNNGPNSHSKLIISACGDDTPIFQPNYTSQHFLTVKFTTDSFNQARGFNLTFETILDYCQKVKCPTNMYCINLDQDQGYDCVCKAGWSGNLCDQDIDECQQNPCLNGATCNNSPGSYSCKCVKGYAGLNCEVDQYCKSDTCVHDGTCTHGTTGPICICPDGFTGAHCEKVDCGGTLSGATGVVSSPNFPSAYYPLSDCYWYITVDSSMVVNVHFTSFAIEMSPKCVDDSLTIWFTTDKSQPFYNIYCGIKDPFDVQSTTNQMTLYFHSDNSIQFSGFSTTYTSVPPVEKIEK